jgi:hypothetical protein
MQPYAWLYDGFQLHLEIDLSLFLTRRNWAILRKISAQPNWQSLNEAVHKSPLFHIRFVPQTPLRAISTRATQ